MPVHGVLIPIWSPCFNNVSLALGILGFIEAAAIFQRFRSGRRGRADSVWHLDMTVVRINGQRIYMWRAVYKEGEVLEHFVESRRDKA